MLEKLLIAVIVCTFYGKGQCALKLANIFHSHMVLQRGPQQAVVWGTADTAGDTVTLTLTHGSASPVSVTTTVGSNHKWKMKLPAQTATTAFTLTAKSPDGTVTLSDVLFGDVWLCSGQSNMYFTLNQAYMRQVMNSSDELALAHHFPNVRFARAALVQNTHPLDEMTFDIPWTGPNTSSLTQTSAVCWLFAQYLYPKLNHPIGLIESSWGGTTIEAWSPPEVFTDCAHRKKRGPATHSVLWNAMINPLRSMTMYGALWYQGEQNSQNAGEYTCQIQSMVKRWREQFHQQSLTETSSLVPFGYVQLAGHNSGTLVGSFPMERWAQTANYGYSPNPALPNTFMAVAMDLPDFNSPYGAIHPRYKQDVAERLVLGALNVAYGHSSVDFQGPFPSSVTESAHHLTIVYDNGHAHLDVRLNNGFDVCCMPTGTHTCNDAHAWWAPAPILSHQASQVTIDASGCSSGRQAAGIRYEWRTSPCNYKQCALYDSVSGLPAPPYISHTLTAIQGPEIIG